MDVHDILGCYFGVRIVLHEFSEPGPVRLFWRPIREDSDLETRTGSVNSFFILEVVSTPLGIVVLRVLDIIKPSDDKMQ